MLIVLPKNFLIYSFDFDPTAYRGDLRNDSFSGGNSVVEWVDEKTQHWSCSMGSGFATPYCSLHLPVVDALGKGLDLSRIHKMKIWMTYKGNGNHLRIYLRNRSASYYIPNDELSTKYNTVEIPVDGLENGLEINMADFTVASWWLIQRNIPLKDSKPEFNDIVAIEVQTGSASSTGVHEIQLKRIEWQRPLITELGLYRGITIMWTVLIVGFLAFRLLHMRLELNRHKSRQQELLTINNLLSLQNKQFEDLAKTDPLTGLLNRIGVRDALYDGLMAWKKNQTPFSMVLVDVDYFKRINDTYGHDVGDEILKATAEILRSSVRKTDYVARWGGEEFVLLCPNTNRVQAMSAAETMRKRMAAEPVYRDIRVTASFGVATIAQADLDHLFKSADEALYRAKNRGRNCVMSDVKLSA